MGIVEKSSCRILEVLDTPEGRIAVIDITGRHDGIPDPEASKPPYGDYTVTSGEIRFNLDTGQLVSQRIENVIGSWRGQAPEPGDKFVDTLAITPLR